MDETAAGPVTPAAGPGFRTLHARLDAIAAQQSAHGAQLAAHMAAQKRARWWVPIIGTCVALVILAAVSGAWWGRWQGMRECRVDLLLGHPQR